MLGSSSHRTTHGQISGSGEVFFMLQPPLFHISCRSLETATRLRNLGQENGFKYSTIRSLRWNSRRQRPEKITVELLSTETLNVPIAKEGKLMVDDIFIVYLYEKASKTFPIIMEKLRRLKTAIDLWDI